MVQYDHVQSGYFELLSLFVISEIEFACRSMWLHFLNTVRPVTVTNSVSIAFSSAYLHQIHHQGFLSVPEKFGVHLFTATSLTTLTQTKACLRRNSRSIARDVSGFWIRLRQMVVGRKTFSSPVHIPPPEQPSSTSFSRACTANGRFASIPHFYRCNFVLPRREEEKDSYSSYRHGALSDTERDTERRRSKSRSSTKSLSVEEKDT